MGTLKREIDKSMESDKVHPQVIRKLDNVIAGPFSIIFKRLLGLGNVPRRLEESKCHTDP